MRYLKQDSLVFDRKETGKSLYDFAMVVLSFMSLYGLSLKNISPWISIINTHEQITDKIRNRIIKYLIPIYRIKIHKQT